MMILIKTFPKLQIITFFLIYFFSCSSNTTEIIEEDQFIEFYARLLIIHEMTIAKEKQAQLVQNLMKSYQVTSEDLKNTLNYYNDHPEEWVPIIGKIRDHINQIKSKRKPDKIL